MSIDPTTPSYSNHSIPNCILLTAAWLSIGGAVTTLWVVYDAWTNKHVTPLYVAIGCWAVLPPVWFWLEYLYVYRVYGMPDTLELFKYGQDVAKSIWAGVLAGLIAFAASDATKPVPQNTHLNPPQTTSGL